MEEQNITYIEEKEIDLFELARKIWEKRAFVFKICGVGVVLGLIIAFSLPKEYKTEVKLSPENAQTNKSGQLSGLAAMAGFNVGGAKDPDALSVDLYPDIVSSTPFLLELVDLPVTAKTKNVKVSFYEYMTEYQKIPWWNYVKIFPFKTLNWILSYFKDGEQQENSVIDPFQLTEKQENFIRNVKARTELKIDKKSGVIVVSVTMQDPLVSAVMADIIVTKLQEYITDYRTRKAKQDLAFSEKLYVEADSSYYKARKTYAAYIDANKNVVYAKSKTEEERLRNEMNLAFSVFTQMAQQLESNKIKVQEETPVYVVIEPARMPILAVKPNKLKILFAFVLLFGFGSVVKIIGSEYFFKKNM